jgi:diguanylate cyclase (GGDEF)-like protein/PAS domain S-box-containing protein
MGSKRRGPGPRRRAPIPGRRAIEVVLVALAALWVVLVALRVGGSDATEAVSDVGQTAAAVAAAALSARRAGRDAARRAFWRLLAVAIALWGAGQACWTYSEAVLGQDTPFPGPPDVGFLGASLVFVVALVSIARIGVGAATRGRALLDGLLIAGSLLLTSWLFVLGPVYHAAEGSTAGRVVSLAYPVLDVVVLSLLAYTQVGSRRSAAMAPLPFGLLSLGVLAIMLADSTFAIATAQGWYATGSLLNAGWVVGFVLIGLASLDERCGADAGPVEAATEHAVTTLAPYAALSVALVASLAGYWRYGDRSLPVFAMQAILSFSLMMRQLVTIRENRMLTRSLERRVRDRTRELSERERRFRALVLHSSDVITVVDRRGTVLYQSDSVARVFGYRPEELVGLTVDRLVHEDHRPRLLETLALAVEEPGRPHVVELPVRHRDERVRAVEITMTSLLDDPAVRALVMNTRDVTEERALSEQLRHQAFHDSLTALANRALFSDRLAHAVARRARTDVHLLHLDLDGFKEVNDTLGHSLGDTLLVAVADRLRRCARREDTVARLGGDEFAILLERGSVEDAATIAGEILRAFDEPFSGESHEPLHVRPSIGIATASTDGVDAETLLRNADLAMYRAKTTRSGYALYESAMHEELRERIAIAREIPHAIETDELYLRFQPTVSLATGALVGVEALVRWNHPRLGPLAPDAFLPIAEANGSIAEVGYWVLRNACRQAVDWHERHPDRHLSMNVNMTAADLRDPTFPARVRSVLAESGLAARLLVLELTETTLVAELERCATALAELRELGLRIAIDDFGTGYSSLNYVHRLPIDMLKIDRSFVDNVDSELRNMQIVHAIVSLGRSLDLVTVAEGVETAEQVAVLRRMGCHIGQGFRFGRPLSAAEIGRMLGAADADAA